jgi:uracil-DNA glycosylase family 4
MADERAEALGKIAETIKVCKLCDLWKTRTKAVPGAGDIYAEIMFIGEGPGYNEDKQGLPFVGQSGKYLETLLKLLNLTRNQVFITNVVKCRPPENRDPLPIEINTCVPTYLNDQIALINPLIIVTLGRFSMGLYFPNGRITQIHGQAKIENGRAYLPLFHPAAVLRDPSKQPQMEADFKRIPEILEKVRAARDGGKKPPPPPKDEAPPKQMSLF